MGGKSRFGCWGKRPKISFFLTVTYMTQFVGLTLPTKMALVFAEKFLHDTVEPLQLLQ